MHDAMSSRKFRDVVSVSEQNEDSDDSEGVFLYCAAPHADAVLFNKAPQFVSHRTLSETFHSVALLLIPFMLFRNSLLKELPFVAQLFFCA